ncbi:hypothetical protein [Phytomonospora endophytica]|uniref:Uncharacterized protein n=1 Tax=Phytomonospora endophytica TaxID=714109 RepID=A0A841FUL5_9ACTN|nr:hypothetical protein [Phytomonospora endophytica]MBB6037037.1 hypothetical protein [Phytomonospora endophytica]
MQDWTEDWTGMVGGATPSACVRMQGRSAVVLAELDEAECARRGDDGPGIESWEALDLLMTLPQGESVPERVLTPAQKLLLDGLPEWAVERSGGNVVRLSRVPLRPLLAVAFTRRWAPGLRTAHVFSSMCAQAVVLPSEPGDPLIAIEADQYGVGLGVGAAGVAPRSVVVPEPYRLRRHTVARWWFAEHVYGLLVAQKRRALGAGENSLVDRQRLDQRL